MGALRFLASIVGLALSPHSRCRRCDARPADISPPHGRVLSSTALAKSRRSARADRRGRETCPASLPLELSADDGISFDRFGFSIAMSGDYLVVGAFKDSSGNKIAAGSAYVFRFDGSSFVQQQKLVANDSDDNDWFGYSVAIDGDVLVVGAHRDGDDNINSGSNGVNSGSVYVFRQTGSGTWNQQQKLTASDGEADDWFGESVTVSGNVLVVGAEKDNTAAGFDAGGVYVFGFDGTSWTQQQKLTAGDASANDNFGETVAIDGGTIVVGAAAQSKTFVNGAAYIYAKGGTSSWALQKKITASDGAAGDQFGTSASIQGDTLVIGAPGKAKAYVFRSTGGVWIEEQILTVTGGPTDFGHSVAMNPSGNVIVVGIGFDTEEGSSYVFNFDGTSWLQQGNLLETGGEKNIFFGFSAALTDRFVAVGAFGQLNNKGSAYMFCAPGTEQEVQDTSGVTFWSLGTALGLKLLCTTALLMV